MVLALPISTWRRPATPEIGDLTGGVVELGLGGWRLRRRQPQAARSAARDGGTLGVGLRLAGREFAELGEALQIQIGVGEIGLVPAFLALA